MADSPPEGILDLSNSIPSNERREYVSEFYELLVIFRPCLLKAFFKPNLALCMRLAGDADKLQQTIFDEPPFSNCLCWMKVTVVPEVQLQICLGFCCVQI
jgi:hypothetical protein